MLQSALKAGLALGFAATAMGAEASTLKPAAFEDLPGWKNDKHGEVVVAFRRSCERMLIADPEAAISNHGIGGKFKDWKAACEALRQVDVNDHEAVRAFFETHFQPWLTLNKIEKKVRVKGKGKRKRTKTVVSYANSKGMCTGYYDAWMKGSLVQDEVYTVPVFAPPPDKEKWSRRQIMTGEWPHNDKAIAYVKSFVDVLYLQIQGSGVIELPDGRQIRLDWGGKNGHTYRSVPGELLRRGIINRSQASMQGVRDWLESHTGDKRTMEAVYANESYLFFNEIPMEDGPKGSEGVVLTPQRSIAVDSTRLPYGLPIWLDTSAYGKPIQRMVVGQDTGIAIRGNKRCDYYWGGGKEGEAMASSMKSPADSWILLPKPQVEAP